MLVLYRFWIALFHVLELCQIIQLLKQMRLLLQKAIQLLKPTTKAHGIHGSPFGLKGAVVPVTPDPVKNREIAILQLQIGYSSQKTTTANKKIVTATATKTAANDKGIRKQERIVLKGRFSLSRSNSRFPGCFSTSGRNFRFPVLNVGQPE